VSVLCQCHAVFIAMDLQYSLKSGIITQALLFLLRVDLAIWGLLWFYINFRIFSSFMKNVIGILTGISLDL
jgi:hypothetical protein